jgi:hypothetical protein
LASTFRAFGEESLHLRFKAFQAKIRDIGIRMLSEKTSPKTVSLPSIGGGRKPKKKLYCFWLTEIVNDAVNQAATMTGCSRSRVLENVFCTDIVSLFQRFEDGESFSKIAIDTYLPPDRIREAYAQWKQGFERRREEMPVVVKMKTEVQKLRLEVKKEVAESNERIAKAKLEASRDNLKTRMDIEEIKAGSKARELRAQSLSRSRFTK